MAGRVRTAKYLLQPTAGQRVRLDHLVWQQRKLYNRALEERRKAWQEEGRSLSRYEQFAGLNGMAETDPELGRYGTCVARRTLTRLDQAYKAFYRRCKAGDKPGHPRFKGRRAAKKRGSRRRRRAVERVA
ncbi:MAG: helix-turn-helix domain-containing protein, partial [Actinobacteria bacterium]|nr:helix-turn-helix domain-containing protein [Actinomycetota bacterium]